MCSFADDMVVASSFVFWLMSSRLVMVMECRNGELRMDAEM
jgi:hypothetical protein